MPHKVQPLVDAKGDETLQAVTTNPGTCEPHIRHSLSKEADPSLVEAEDHSLSVRAIFF